jgi:hypothetical protein
MIGICDHCDLLPVSVKAGILEHPNNYYVFSNILYRGVS